MFLFPGESLASSKPPDKAESVAEVQGSASYLGSKHRSSRGCCRRKVSSLSGNDYNPLILLHYNLQFFRQAVLAISSILSTGGQWGQLRGLLHRKEHKRLQQVHLLSASFFLAHSLRVKYKFRSLRPQIVSRLRITYSALIQVVEKQWTDVERRRLEIDEEHLLFVHITDCRTQQINQFK